MTELPEPHPLWGAIEPLLAVVGGDIVTHDEATAGDIAILWEGEPIGAVRLGSFAGALERLIGHIEAEFGAPLTELSRTAKQDAIRILDEQGAFLLRRSVDDVADRMGVSRITVYNYLANVRGD